jgi:hypothetical protein
MTNSERRGVLPAAIPSPPGTEQQPRPLSCGRDRKKGTFVSWRRARSSVASRCAAAGVCLVVVVVNQQGFGVSTAAIWIRSTRARPPDRDRFFGPHSFPT